MRGIAVALACALVGCAAPIEADWYGDERLTAEQRREVEAGAAWMYAQQGQPPPVISWTYEAGGEPAPRTISRASLDWVAPGLPSWGFCDGQSVRLDLDEVPFEMLAAVVAHELGHCAFGLAHTDCAGGPDIMCSPQALAPSVRGW